MTRTALTVTTSASTGTVQPAFAAVDSVNGNNFTNTGRELIEITNAAAAPITVTFITELTYQGLNIADVNATVTNATTKVFGPFDVNLFSPTTGTVGVDFSSGTSVTARVTKLGTS